MQEDQDRYNRAEQPEREAEGICTKIMKGYYRKQKTVGMLKEIHGEHEMHFHEDMEICYCREGSVEISINGEAYVLSQGDVGIVFPNVPHGYRRTEASIHCIVLVYLPEAEDDFYAELNGMLPKCPVLRKGALPEEAKRILLQFYALFGDGQRRDKRLFDAYARLLSAHLLLELELVMRETLYSPDTVQTVMHYVNRHFSEPLTLKGTAKGLGMSTSALSRIFSEQLNTSFVEYVNMQRVSYVKKKLRNSDAALKQISSCSGFSSVRTFFRVFREHTGMTPTQYRNAHRNKKKD